MSRTSLTSVLAAAFAAILTAAPTGATTDRLTYLTFNRSVQVPGALLDAGTYRFHLADDTSSRKIVQVLSHDGSVVYSMFFTREDWRTKITDKPTVTFRETPAGVPPAVRSLFYGGERRGYEFVYDRSRMMTAEPALAQPPITYTPIPATAPPAAYAEPAPAAVPGAATPEPAAAEPVPLAAESTAAAPEEMPTTASPLPLVALGGLLTLLAGVGAGLVGRART